MKTRILIVDDESDILELIDYNLINAGYETAKAKDGEEALQKIKKTDFDLILLDLMLPGIDGFELCKIIKADEKYSGIPVIMLTAKSSESDKVAGLEIGADYYITKPFSPRELLAVIKATLRSRQKAGEPQKDLIKRGVLEIHIGKHEVFLKNKKLDFTNLEFNILLFLVSKPGWVFTRQQIMETTRGEGIIVTDRSIDVHIVSLRKKLGAYSGMIQTIRGVGYKFTEAE